VVLSNIQKSFVLDKDTQALPSDFLYAQSLSESSNSSLTVWSEKLSITAPSSLTNGDYFFNFFTMMRTAAANRETDIRILINSTSVFNKRFSLIRTQGEIPVSVQFVLPLDASDIISVEFKVGGSSTTSFLNTSTLTLWRIS
jgi:hypothetical protein